MNKKTIIILIILVLFIVGVYFFGFNKTGNVVIPAETDQEPITSGENPQPGSAVHDLPVEPAATLARKDLASRLSVGEKSIVIIQITEATWNDGCLGLGGPAESCLQALVPGFKIEMLAKGKTYFYRTDKTGSMVRVETQ